MRTVGFVVGAMVLVALVLAPAFAAQPFSDVPQDHWAYNAISKLADAGAVEGYPDGTFKGKRNLTRYEFAVAIARIMDRLQGTPGPQGPAGPAGPQGPAGAPGQVLTAEQQALLNKLATEFAPELQALRSDLNDLTKKVADLEGKIGVAGPAAPMVQLGGNINWRTGVYGTNLGFEDVKTTGYPFTVETDFVNENATSPFGGIVLPDRVAFIDPDTGLLVSGWGDNKVLLDAFFANVFGTVNLGEVSSGVVIPISDALKDSFKAGDFMSMRTRVWANATLSPCASAFVQLLAGPTTNLELANFLSPDTGTFFTGNGLMDVVQFDQIYLKYGTRFITPVELTIGKQYERRGVGLLFDNDQEAVKALRADFGSGSLRVGTFLGMLDPEQFLGVTFTDEPSGVNPITGNPLETDGQDNINLFYLDWAFAPGWKLGGNWLQSGFNEEQGWSASLSGPIWGLGFYGEFAQLTQWPIGEDTVFATDTGLPVRLDKSDEAWLAGLTWSNCWLNLVGEYGQVDAGYAFAGGGGGWSAFPFAGTWSLPLSALHPRAEIDPHDINWIDRPLFLDPTNIAKGWHVQATFPTLLGGKTPLTVSYANGSAYNPEWLSWWSVFGGFDPNTDLPIREPGKWRDADPVWWVKISHQMSDSVTASLLYGRREVDNVMSPDLVPVSITFDPVTGAAIPHFATNDAIQTIRAEVSVAF